MKGWMQGGRRTEQIKDIYDTREPCMFGRKTHEAETDLNASHANTHVVAGLYHLTQMLPSGRGGKKK